MRTQTTILATIMVLCLSTAAQAKYSGGAGEPNDPYLIATAEDMNAIGANSNDWGAHFLLVADINLADYTGTQFNIIGSESIPFVGVFDGNDHKIRNFTWDSNGISHIGLFGYVYTSGQIKNLGMENVDVNAVNCGSIGGLVGRNESGTITNCYTTGSVSGGGGVGGLVGANWENGTILNCYTTASVTGSGGVGGLVGSNGYGTISNCYSTGSVSGEIFAIGGLAGYNYGTISDCHATGSVSGNNGTGGLVGSNWDGTITDCYATGSVSGDEYVGGLVGDHRHNTISNCYATGSVDGNSEVGGLVGLNEFGTITNCYSTGSILGGHPAGGLVGSNDYSSISNCYSTGSVPYGGGLVGYDFDGKSVVTASFWDVNTSGQTNSAGGIGKTTAEMKTAGTYFGWSGCIWTIDEGNDYPHLVWEGKPGQPLFLLLDFLEGIGTQDDPYQISNAEQLNLIGMFPCEWDKHFILVNDVNLEGVTGTQFNIIGNADNPFTGVFDGNGKRIWNFTWTSTGKSYIGLFGYIGEGGRIKNLGLENVNVNGGTGDYVGGLVGGNHGGAITNCYATGSVTGKWNVHVGGLMGWNDGTITNCYSTGSITGDIAVGGLVGVNHYYGTISNSYSIDEVSGRSATGGLVGANHGMVSNCYATGRVTGGGGLMGYNDAIGVVIASFWDIETSGCNTSAGGTGLPTEQMQAESTFIDAGWDFVCETVNGANEVWTIRDGVDYPKLVWQECFPLWNEGYQDWLDVNKPPCWCYPRQCHGDADNRKEGNDNAGYSYCHFDDLNLLLSAWNIKEPNYGDPYPGGSGIAWPDTNICADFDHKAEGSTKSGYYRVHFNDLNILLNSWSVKEPPDGPGIEPNCLDCP